MDLICSCNSLSTGQSNPEPNKRLYNTSQINHASIANEQYADITIRTAEGDKVTLSSQSRSEASLTNYSNLVRTNAAYAESQGRLMALNAKRQITIGVEGDLNDQEKKEIKKVVKAIFKMMKDFLSGKIENLKEKARKFTDLKTIANLEAEFEFKKNIALVNHSSTRSATYSPIPEEPRASEIDTGESIEAFKPLNTLTDQMIQAVEDSGIKPGKFLKYVDRMFSRLMRDFLKEALGGRNQIDLIRIIMVRFFDKLEKLSTESEDPSSQDTTKAEETSYQSETVQSEKASLLQLSLLEKSNTFRIEYSVGT